MGVKLTDLMVDKEKMEKGTWKDFIPFPGVAVRLLVASNNNIIYLKAVAACIREHLKEFREDVTGQAENEIVKPAVAKHILLGWEGIDDDQGKPISYSYEAALGILNTPELFHLYEFVRVQANIAMNFRKQLNKESEKN